VLLNATLSVPAMLDDWMDNDDGTVIGSVQKKKMGPFSERKYDFNTTPSHEYTYIVLRDHHRPDDHLGEITSVRAHKLKRRYDDDDDTLDTKS
jgi:hypothetical protein